MRINICVNLRGSAVKYILSILTPDGLRRTQIIKIIIWPEWPAIYLR